MDAGQAVGRKVMDPLVPKDASRQAEGLIRTLEPRPECDVYKDRLREAGRGPPAAGTTQWMIGQTYSAAGKAGCVKADQVRGLGTLSLTVRIAEDWIACDAELRRHWPRVIGQLARYRTVATVSFRTGHGR